MFTDGAQSSDSPLPDRPVDDGRPWVAIAANPYSGTGSNRRRVDRLIDALDRIGLPATVLWQPDHCRRRLADPRWMADCAAVVCAGGDGSLNHVVNCRPLAPVTALPIGNENLFAKHFGLTAEPQRLASVIRDGRVLTLDLGRANDRRFVLMYSVGLDSDVVRRVDRWRQAGPALRRVSRLSYVLPILAGLARYPYPTFTLEAEGQTVRAAHLFVFNLPCYGFNLRFAPEARADDGLLDWVAFEHGGRLRSLQYAVRVWRTRHRNAPGVRTGRARTIRITADAPFPAQVDGDLIAAPPITIDTIPAALKVIVPSASIPLPHDSRDSSTSLASPASDD